MPILLVIDDEQGVLYSFQRVFASEQLQVLTARTAAEGMRKVRSHDPNVIVLDLQLPDRDGMEVFHELHEQDSKRPVIIITAHGTTETAIQAMKGGAFDYLVKPVDLDKLSQLIERAFEASRLMRVPAVLPAQDASEEKIVGRTPVMQEMCKAIGRIAPQDVNVLILGESGSGKELVARALYHHSARAERPFLAINCAAIPETLLESELFGHEQGAFTGAHRRRIGKFEQCDGGTLFLDEIGDMTPALQAKMLRVLEDQSFERLGSNETLRTQVRVLAATNHDLEKLVEDGKFRKDLYYRLNVVTIRVPALRERLGDVPELAHYFLFRYNSELNLDLRGFDPQALEILQSCTWPGNVRELQSIIKQAMLSGTGHILLAEFLPEHLRRHQSSASSRRGGEGELSAFVENLLQKEEPKNLHTQVIEHVEKLLFTRVLNLTKGHQAQASEILGINRTTLRHKLRSLGLTVDKVVAEESEADEVGERS